MKAITLATTLLVASGQSGQPATSATPPRIQEQCVAMAASSPGSLRIIRAELVPAQPMVLGRPGPNGAPPPGAPMPEHCLIEGALEQRTGADGKDYAIAIQMRVPVKWNGRLVYQGGGGLNGAVNPAVGLPVSHTSQEVPALARGYAVVSTDSGHVAAPGTMGTDASFARDQQAKLNYAYGAIGKVAEAARAVLEELTGQLPSKTYFVGCSNGGREGMIAAQRYPTLFDGVVAGNPAFNLSKAVLLARYTTRQLAAGGVTAADLQLVGKEVVKACDALDGRRDGMIFNQAACRFRPSALICKPGRHKDCLSSQAAVAIERAFRGPVDEHGVPLYHSWAYDGGVGDPSWLIWQTGAAPAGSPMAGRFPKLITDTIAQYFSYPAIDSAALDKMDTAQLAARMSATAAMTDAISTDFSTFRKRGGKLLIVTGWSDPIFAPEDLIAWYLQLDAAAQAQGGTGATSFARLFLVPGMTHCGGGPAFDDFDALTALESWTENGKAPDLLLAHGQVPLPAQGPEPTRESRPLCAYPSRAIYAHGKREQEGAFVCR